MPDDGLIGWKIKLVERPTGDKLFEQHMDVPTAKMVDKCEHIRKYKNYNNPNFVIHWTPEYAY